MGNLLILFGVIFILLGLLLTIFPKLGLPHLPGDILVERHDFTFYLPITTAIILSIVITFLINLFK